MAVDVGVGVLVCATDFGVAFSVSKSANCSFTSESLLHPPMSKSTISNGNMSRFMLESLPRSQAQAWWNSCATKLHSFPAYVPESLVSDT